MSVISEFEEYLNSFPIGTIFKNGDLKKDLSLRFNRSQGSYIPSDFSYNVINFPYFNSYANRPHYFLQKEDGYYEYVGKDYKGNCNVFYKKQEICGNWDNGCFCPNENYYNRINSSQKVYTENKIFTDNEAESINNTEIGKSEIDIQSIIKELSIKHPIFTCEAEFQFYLAWEIKQQYGEDFNIILEHPVIMNNSNRYIDLLLVNKEGKHIPIELKYKTKAYECKHNCHMYKLKNHGADDITRYSYLKDVERIEFMQKYDPNFLVGYAIIITNQICVWEKSPCENEISYEFSLENSKTITQGTKCYRKTTQDFLKNHPELYISNNYNINWQNYADFCDKNGCFKILITEVSRSEQ